MSAPLPYPGIPSTAPIRIVEDDTPEATTSKASSTTEPTQPTPPPHPSHPHHFSFPRLSLHALTLKSHVLHHGRRLTSDDKSASSTSSSNSTAWAPATDVRETHGHYHIEIEVPGVLDKDTILIQWMSPHTLLVQGENKRPTDIGSLATNPGERVWEGEADGWPREVGRDQDNTDGAPLVRTPSRETMEADLLADLTPTVVLAERKLGTWRRTFTLPEDVQMRELRARLEGGLLRIALPKRGGVGVRGLRVQVE